MAQPKRYKGGNCVHCEPNDEGVLCCYYDDPHADIAAIGFTCKEERCPLLNSDNGGGGGTA